MACLVRRHSSPAVLFHTTWALVVVAVRAQRLSERGSSRSVAGEAGQRSGRAGRSGVAAGMARLRLARARRFVGTGVQPHGPGVDGAEGGGGESREDGRVGGDVFGDAFAAGQPGADELESITPVGFGTGRACGGAAVPAGLVDDAVRQSPGRQRRDDLAGAGVNAVDVSAEADRVGASGGGPDVIQPGVIGVRVERAGRDVLAVACGPVAVAGAGERAGGGVSGGRRRCSPPCPGRDLVRGREPAQGRDQSRAAPADTGAVEVRDGGRRSGGGAVQVVQERAREVGWDGRDGRPGRQR